MTYSSAVFKNDDDDLSKAQINKYQCLAELADIKPDDHVLEIGCGWGGFAKYVTSTIGAKVTGITISREQHAFAQRSIHEAGLADRADVRLVDYRELDGKFDKIVSIEMFEHMRNWHQLLERIHSWLAKEGCLFIHIFVHRELAYLFDGQGGVNWMAEHFFKEGMMPAESLLPLCNQHLITEQIWRVNGTHYAKTLRAWLEKIDENRRAAIAILTRDLDVKEAHIQWRRWRIFFMACEELFGFNGGNEWYVAHYRLIKR